MSEFIRNTLILLIELKKAYLLFDGEFVYIANFTHNWKFCKYRIVDNKVIYGYLSTRDDFITTVRSIIEEQDSIRLEVKSRVHHDVSTLEVDLIFTSQKRWDAILNAVESMNHIVKNSCHSIDCISENELVIRYWDRELNVRFMNPLILLSDEHITMVVQTCIMNGH